MTKRIPALLLCILLCVSMLPAAAFAEDLFEITIVVDGKRENVYDGMLIPPSGEYEQGEKIALPGFNDDCFCGWYEGNDKKLPF